MHIDNYLIFYKNKKIFDKLIKSLKDDFKVANKSNLEIFPSIKFKNHNFNSLELI